jgi:hypothetical protein
LLFFYYLYFMNTTDLKSDIKRQVDELDENLLNDLAMFLRNRVKLFSESVLEGLSDSQIEAIKQAQNSIKQGLGLSHPEVMNKFKAKYGMD